ncbi:hypothetical protein ED733_007272 [Metarhizium rileyi]|uniref:MAGE domain-containing protein n=1 Tax=Metarhizium rileyi (strain RCEF 4871) TaxID=1649241 RepID=A0A5C6GGB6_METRR|nr:hypothetical protein ED733_007272 [Metarhizium rileyi]
MPRLQRRRRPEDDEEFEHGAPPRQRPNRHDPDQDGELDSEDGMNVDGQVGIGADVQLAKKLREVEAFDSTSSNEVKFTDDYRIAAIIKPSQIPTSDDEATYAAFYTLVVSFIWLNGGELSEQKLRRYLLRLNADQNVSSEKTEITLKKMEKHGYVVKRTERPPLGQDGDQTITWHVGPRGKEEIGLDGVIGLVRELYGVSSDDLEKKLRVSLGIKLRTTGDEDLEAETSGTPRRNSNREDQ